MAMNQTTTTPREPVRHVLRFEDAASHYVTVRTTVPTEGRAETEVFMAV
jgi:hypothetical protein